MMEQLNPMKSKSLFHLFWWLLQVAQIHIDTGVISQLMEVITIGHTHSQPQLKPQVSVTGVAFEVCENWYE